MAAALFRASVLQSEFPQLTKGADAAAKRRAAGEEVADVQMLGLIKLHSGKSESGPTQWRFDVYGAQATEALGEVKEQQLFEEAKALRDKQLRKNASHGLRRVSLCVSKLRHASIKNEMLLADLGEYQARVESKVGAQVLRMTAATKASDVLMAMAKAKATERAQVERRKSVGELAGSSAKRQWGKLCGAGLVRGHEATLQRDVKAMRDMLERRPTAPAIIYRSRSPSPSVSPTDA